jgi:hypothetical protein
MGVGAEVGSRYLELRGNYYIPMTGEKLYDRQVTAQTFSSSSTSLSTQGSVYGDPYAAGNSILQPYSSQTLATTTTRTTTVRTVTELFEKGMEGWDAELSLLTPWLDQWIDLRFTGGYLSFDNQPFGPKDGPTGPVHGWKAGVELRPVPAVVLGTTWYEDKRFAGSNWVFSAQLQIPMDKTWKDAFKMRRRHLVEHLAEPVHRQNDAIKVGNREDQESTTTSSMQRVTRVVSQTATNLVLKDDIIFVNNGGAVGNGIQAGSATGNGTAEHPVNTVQAGANLAGANSSSHPGHVWTAYVQGGGPVYTEQVTTTGSSHYFGSSEIIQGMGGKSFGGGQSPFVDGSIVANGGTNPSVRTVSVQGFIVLHGSMGDGTSPIDMTSVPNVTISHNNVLEAYGAGISVVALAPGTTNALINSNFVVGWQGVGISLAALGGGSSLNARILYNNVASPGSTGTGIGVLSKGSPGFGSQSKVTIVGNIVAFNQGGPGISIESDGNGTTLAANVSGNSIYQVHGHGLDVSSRDGSTLTLTASGNLVNSNAGNGFTIQAHDTSTLNVSMAGNTVDNNALAGIELDANDSSTLLSSGITGNVINVATNDNGIYMFRNDSALFSVSIVGNTIQPVTGVTMNDAIYMAGGVGGPGMRAYIIGNTINGVPSSHFGIDAADVDTLLVQNNRITNASGSGILVETTVGGISNAEIVGNVVTANQDALALSSHETSTLTAGVNGNSFALNAANNLTDVSASDTSHLTVGFANNTFGGATVFTGLFFESFDGATLNASLNSSGSDHNVFNTPAGVAVRVVSHDTSALTFTSDRSQITGGTNGILMTSNDTTSKINATLSNNSINGTSAAGISVNAKNTNAVTGISALINNNTITNSGTYGLELLSTSPALIQINNGVGTLGNNIITGSGTASMLGSGSGNSGSIEINNSTFVLPGDAP